MSLVMATLSEKDFALNTDTKLTVLLNHYAPTNRSDACRQRWHK